MASSIPRTITTDYAVEFMLDSDNESCWGMDSDEEEEIDNNLMANSYDTVDPSNDDLPPPVEDDIDDSNRNNNVDVEFVSSDDEVLSKSSSMALQSESDNSLSNITSNVVASSSSHQSGDAVALYSRQPKRKKKVAAVTPKRKKASKKPQIQSNNNKTLASSPSEMKSYDDTDPDTNTMPNFEPSRPPGAHINFCITRQSELQELDFFHLFFTDEIISVIVKHTNTYAWANIRNKPAYREKDGGWKETNSEEMNRFIALIIYQGLVIVPQYDHYWSTKTLYHGLWAREMMSSRRFKALLAFLHVVDPFNENENDKLRKVAPFIDHFKNKCCDLYQPNQNVSVDEKLVKSKHRSGIRQYIKNICKIWH